VEEIDGYSPLTGVREATNVHAMLSNKMPYPSYCSDIGPLFATTEFYMLQTGGSETVPGMSPLRHFEDQWRKSWCAVVVLAAVCSLTVSVATRYSSSWDVSAPKVKTVEAHPTPEAKRQRLDKDAANWVPPLVGFDVLQSPSSYPRTAPAEPPAQNLLLEESLFNRPPPSSEFLS
jgi:hypothetical protein